MATFKVTNKTLAAKTWVGLELAADEEYIIELVDLESWRLDRDVFVSVANGELLVSTEHEDFTDVVEGWRYLSGTEKAEKFPRSDLDGDKISVHSSAKPHVLGGDTYAVWSGAGDDLNLGAHGNGQGPLLVFDTQVGQLKQSIDVKFNHALFGRVWIHEGYLKFTGGGVGDSITGEIMAYAVPLQQAAYLDLVVEDNWIKYSTGGPGTGTHGFADASAITLVDRSFQGDGDWDFDGTNLTPNFAGTGSYKMSDIEQVVHKYINRIPCTGNCTTYFSMTSDETSEVLPGYYLKITTHNQSDTVWQASVLMEIFRQTTY